MWPLLKSMSIASKLRDDDSARRNPKHTTTKPCVLRIMIEKPHLLTVDEGERTYFLALRFAVRWSLSVEGERGVTGFPARNIACGSKERLYGAQSQI